VLLLCCDFIQWLLPRWWRRPYVGTVCIALGR
jgi:hypothetical protein